MVLDRGAFTQVDVPWAGPDGTIPFWITAEGAVVGFYFDPADAATRVPSAEWPIHNH